ncbi:flagellar basal body-associated FliL family protein [Salipiger mangrovisoli]|uniref:Flagellar protein FliL n=1 Tax=Salipiger mangrovisoli TaxID=2865933 RepID=A0ABR9X147_9RHOB|nr:flagellar basal body-associated FliL family protein [Salipiger mangrovisoli]MBE9637151.1 flagellar basal body-associated FliL family protein [Salipiger mangrovisoli]
MADATLTENSSDGPSKRGKLVIALAIALACVAALLAGLVAAAGPARLSALISGEDAGASDPAGHQPAASESLSPAALGAGGAHSPLPKNIISLPFQEIIVNITATTATGRQTSRFLKLNLALIYDKSLPGAEAIESRQLFLRDSFQDYLRQLNESDLQGSIGLARLKAELLRRARAITDSDAPLEFLIADLIIQ